MPLTIDIERMTLERFASMREQLVEENRCAVVDGLFAGQPIAAIATLEKARALMGSSPVVMSRNYMDSKRHSVESFLKGRKPETATERRETSFAAYLDMAAREPGTRWIIGEQPVPPHVIAMADLRALGIESIESGYAERNQPRQPGTAHALMFVANGTNASDLHTDWDGQDVLLYQGFGRKRVVVFPVRSGPLLHPIDIYGTLQIDGMSDEARREFLRFAGGVEHVLEPGEALFMPAFVWHHVGYLDLAMSLSIRLGGITNKNALFLIDNMHRDLYVQNLMAASRHPDMAESCRAAIGALREAYDRPYPSARAKYRAMRSLAKERCLALGILDPADTAETWVEFEDLLEGAQVTAYHFLTKGSRLERFIWHNRERARSLLRRLANRVAHSA